MNSRERVIAALEKKQPDRVPICEFTIDEMIRQKFLKGCSYTEFIEKTGLDVAVVPSDFKKELKKIGHNLYEDDWKVVYRDTGQSALVEVKSPISTKKDLLKFVPPDPLNSDRLNQLKKLTKKLRREKAIIFQVRDAFSRPRKLIGMENLLLNYISDPSFINQIVEMAIDYNLKLLEEAIKIGADIIYSADDYADSKITMMSPKHFEKFILPGLSKIVERTHQFGAKYIKHTDGNIWGILDMIVSSGIDGLHPIDPSAGMDILEVKKKYGNKICLIGNVNCVTTLSTGTEDQVINEVKYLIEKIGFDGGFMIASSNSIHNGVKLENFLAMIDATKKYGYYPIK